MIYLLDTNAVSHLFDPSSPLGPKVGARLGDLAKSDSVSVAVLTIYELATLSAANPALATFEARVKEDFDIEPLPRAAAEIFARLKVGLAKRTGAKVSKLGAHNFDFILAATAIHLSFTLVSNDRIFAALAEIEPALRVEDWTQ